MRYRKIILSILSLFLFSSVLCTSVLAEEEEHTKLAYSNYFGESFENSKLNFTVKDVDEDGLTWEKVTDGKGHHGTSYMTSPSKSDAGFSSETKNELVSTTIGTRDGDILEFYISAKDPSKVGDKISVYEIDNATEVATFLGEFTTTANWQKHEVKLFKVGDKHAKFKFVQEANENNSGINLDCVYIWRKNESNDYPEVKPTCIKDGHKAYYNPVNTEYYFEDEDFTVMIPDINAWLKGDGLLKATGHTMTHHELIEPTYDTEGRKEYYECEVCGKKFADEEGLVPLTDTLIKQLENKLVDPNQKIVYNPNEYYTNEIAVQSHDTNHLVSIKGFSADCYRVYYKGYNLTKQYILFKNECLETLEPGNHKAKVHFESGNDLDIDIVVPEYVKLQFDFPEYDYYPFYVRVFGEKTEDMYASDARSDVIYVLKGDKINLNFDSDQMKLIGYSLNGEELADEFIADSDMVITVDARYNLSSLSMEPTSHDFGKQTVGYKPVDAYEFVIENDGENDLAFEIPELKNYEIVDIEIINNPDATERPLFLGEYIEEYNGIYLDLGDKAILKIKPKDNLAIGKYDEEFKVDAYCFREASVLGLDDSEEQINPLYTTVKTDLSFEVVDKELDVVPATNDSTNFVLYGAISISSLALAIYLVLNRKRHNIK